MEGCLEYSAHNLREVIINALVHADYSQIGAPIRVSFFDDRIEVENPGILLPGMTIEDVKAGVSKIRDPRDCPGVSGMRSD